MVLNYAIVGYSSLVIILYLVSIFLLFDTRKKLDGKARTAFLFFIISVFVLAIRSFQEIFVDSQILHPIPYSAEFVTIGFATLFFIGTFYFHRAIRGVSRVSKVKRQPKPVGIVLLLSGLAVLILVNIFHRFNMLTLPGLSPDLLTLIIILFVITEIGMKSAVGKKRILDKIGWFGIISVTALFLSLVVSWLGLNLSFMEILKASLEAAVLIFVIIEIIR